MGLLNTIKRRNLLVSLSLRDKYKYPALMLCKYISLEVSAINLFANLRVLLVGLDFWAFSSK